MGVDPGIRGGAAVIDCKPNYRPRLVSCIDLPVSGEEAKKRIYAARFLKWILSYNAEIAFVERAQAFKDQGVSSSFLYGRAVGAIEATILCAGIRLLTAEPAVWKRTFGLIGQDKKASLKYARTSIDEIGETLDLAKDEHKAESMLIAIYGAIRYGVPVVMPVKDRLFA